MNKNSMLYWWPKVRNLDIPMPKTEIVRIDMTQDEIFGILDGEVYSAEAWHPYVQKILEAINEVKVPAFIRTDLTSGKHDWEKTCYYDGSKLIQQHISSLVEYCEMADMIGLNISAIIVREYIPMLSAFTAFYGKMPVNPERRYFVRDGRVECHHPYWIEEAIAAGTREGLLPADWRDVLQAMNTEIGSEVQILTEYAEIIAAEFDGYWSVDFCKAKNKGWHFIDMAQGDASWHPEHT